ncbi:MAG: ABC transporter substrate-binding protein [Alphaproteobacteria bacterium]|nr:ABC transporter substrate-binding protein [Alphaproteobacteria bacterium]
MGLEVGRRALLVMVAAVALPRAARAEGASAFVQTLGDEALDLLMRPPGSEKDRVERLRSILTGRFDLKTIGRAVLGPSWKSADETQREAYLTIFEDYVVATYSLLVKDYSGETFEVLKETPIDERDSLVATQIVRRNKAPLRVDYRVRNKDGAYHVIDVMVEGISMLTSQRQEFAAVIQRDGVDGLISQLRARAVDILGDL